MTASAYKAGEAIPEYRCWANNGAAHSENKIHEDTVAKQYGFKGGLVPGVTVHAYLARPLVNAYGRDWVERGTISTRFDKPFYQGNLVVAQGQVTALTDAGAELELHAMNEHEDWCGLATATMPGTRQEPPPLADFPEAPLPAARPRATAEVLNALQTMGSLTQPWDGGKQYEAFLAEVEDEHPLWRGPEAVLHPGYLIRFANTILVRNVELGPWIHVSSEVTHFQAIPAGTGFTTRGHVLETFERKGHKFVVLDVLIATEAGDPALRARHTAIYEPRKGSSPGA